MSKESFSEFVDRVRYVILKAPDRFPKDTNMDLEKAFSELFRGVQESRNEFGPLSERVSGLLDKALTAYRSGDVKNGIRSLQEVDSIASKRE